MKKNQLKSFIHIAYYNKMNQSKSLFYNRIKENESQRGAYLWGGRCCSATPGQSWSRFARSTTAGGCPPCIHVLGERQRFFSFYSIYYSIYVYPPWGREIFCLAFQSYRKKSKFHKFEIEQNLITEGFPPCTPALGARNRLFSFSKLYKIIIKDLKIIIKEFLPLYTHPGKEKSFV